MIHWQNPFTFAITMELNQWWPKYSQGTPTLKGRGLYRECTPGDASAKFIEPLVYTGSFPGGSDGKSVCLQCGRRGFDPWVEKIPWRRKWQPTSVLLPGKFHGWRSLVGYSPWGCKESDTTEQLHCVCVCVWYKNCINLNYVEMVHSAFQVFYILLLFRLFILLLYESLILKLQLKILIYLLK